MTREVKLTILGAVLVLLPLGLFVGAVSYQVVNGEVTQYNKLNLAAIACGIAAIGVAIALFRRSARPRAGWLVPVVVVLVVLGAVQVVIGTGVVPSITGCTSESGTLGFCTPTHPDS